MRSLNKHFPDNLLHPERALSLKERFAAIAADPTLSPLDRRVAEEASARAGRAVDERTPSQKRGSFIMSYAHENYLVLDWLMLNSSCPKVAGRLWGLLLAHMSTEPEHDGEVLLTRDGLLSRLARPGGPPVSKRAVEAVLAELEDIGAITRKREAVPGLRGRGPVRIFISERVATRKKGTLRSNAYKAAPPLRLKMIGGTDLSSERRSFAPSFPPAVL